MSEGPGYAHDVTPNEIVRDPRGERGPRSMDLVETCSCGGSVVIPVRSPAFLRGANEVLEGFRAEHRGCRA